MFPKRYVFIVQYQIPKQRLQTLEYRMIKKTNPIKNSVMKRSITVMGILTLLLAWGCDYDDSNDIDILTPNDSTATGLQHTQKTAPPLD